MLPGHIGLKQGDIYVFTTNDYYNRLYDIRLIWCGRIGKKWPNILNTAVESGMIRLNYEIQLVIIVQLTLIGGSILASSCAVKQISWKHWRPVIALGTEQLDDETCFNGPRAKCCALN